MEPEATDPLADYVEAANAKEFGTPPPVAEAAPEPVAEAAPVEAEPAKEAAEPTEADEAAAVSDEVEVKPKREAWVHPETGETVDGRTRAGKKIIRQWQEIESLRARVAELSAAARPSTTSTQAPAAAVSTESPRPTSPGATKPTLDQFETVEQWEDAVYDWRTARDKAVREAEQARTHAQTAFTEHQAREAAARTTYPDYDVVVSKPLAFALTPTLQQQLIESKQSADLVYYLAQHPDELRQLTTLSPLHSARELGRLEATLTAATPKPPAPARSAAPPPGQPIKTNTPTSGVNLETLVSDVDAYVETVNRNPRLIGATR